MPTPVGLVEAAFQFALSRISREEAPTQTWLPGINFQLLASTLHTLCMRGEISKTTCFDSAGLRSILLHAASRSGGSSLSSPQAIEHFKVLFAAAGAVDNYRNIHQSVAPRYSVCTALSRALQCQVQTLSSRHGEVGSSLRDFSEPQDSLVRVYRPRNHRPSPDIRPSSYSRHFFFHRRSEEYGH